ncbi:MAG TPA: alpha/beta fold hydrolase [Solirubrobacteraceae bacterium]
MSARESAVAVSAAPIWGELRYSGELASLLALTTLRPPRRRSEAAPVLMIPGFMAGDASLAMMRRWLRRRGHRVSMSGLRANVDCAERIVGRLELQLQELAADSGRGVVLIGQSRGGALARALAVRDPDSVSALVTLGTPVRDSLAVSAPVLRTVRWMARLGDLGLPGVFSSSCGDGECCEEFRAELSAPLAERIEAVAVYSRSDAIVDWHACLDPYAENVEVDSSHCGMSVHPAVYRLLDHVLDGAARSPAPLPAVA